MVSRVLPSAATAENAGVPPMTKLTANAPPNTPGIYLGPASNNTAKAKPPPGQKMVTLDSKMAKTRPSLAMLR